MNFPEIHSDVGKRTSYDDRSTLRTSDKPVETIQHPDAQRTGVTAPEKQNTDASGEHALSREQTRTIVREMEDKLREMNVSISFEVHEDLDTVQVELRDGEGNVVKKIPSDELVKLSQNIQSGRLSGTLDLDS